MAVKKFITKATTEKLAKKVKALFATKAELGNAVSIVANQGLSATEKVNARENIGIMVVSSMPASPDENTIYIVK